jgi:hypothetical protein
MEIDKFGHPICVGRPRQQNHHAINARIFSNPQPRQTWSEKKKTINPNK